MRKLIAAIAMSIVLIGTLAPVAFSLNKKSTLPVGNFSEVSLTMEVQKAFAIAPNTDGTCPADYPVKDTQTGDCVAVSNNSGSNATANFDCGNFDFACKITTFVIDLITFVPNFIAVLLGALSDVFLKLSISPGMYGATAGGAIDSGIRDAWKIVRDFSNIGFIFALFVAAFMLILDKTSVGGTQFEPKKVVVRVIIMALLVNFSLLFCRLTIQTADIFSNLLYSKLGSYDYSKSSNDTAATVGNIFNDTLHMKSVSLPLISLASPQELFLNGGITPGAEGRNAAYLIIGFSIFFVLLLLIWTFASMMFVFLGRILGLWLGIILSPLAFVSFAIPFLEKNEFIGFDSWLKNFFELAFMTPVYLFFMYITISILNIKGIGTGMMDNIGAPGANTPWLVSVLKIVVSTMIPLLMSCFLLLQGKKIAVKMSGQIGELVSGATGMVTGMAMGAATGGTAFLGRQTAGRLGAGLASATADSPRLSGLNTIGKSLSTSTFDVRNNKFAMDKFGKVTGAMGEKVELGTENLQEKGGYGATGGVRQVLQDRKDRIADEKATAAEKEALERANNPQSRENIQKRNTERQIAANAKAKENEESRIALEAENKPIDITKDKKELEEKIVKADQEIADNNAKMAAIDADIATKPVMTPEQLAANANVQQAAETLVKSIEVQEAEVKAQLAANAAKKWPVGMGAQVEQERAAITKEKTDLEAKAATLAQEKTNQQGIIAEAKDKAKGAEVIKTLETEKAALQGVNAKKEAEKQANQNKLVALDGMKGKTPAQIRDEAEVKKAEAAGSKQKADLDKAEKDAAEEAAKVAELQEKIKKAEKEKDTKLVEDLKKELNGENWDEIEILEEKVKKEQNKEEKKKLREQIAEKTGGKQAKLNEKRSSAIAAKSTYENAYGKEIKSMEDFAKAGEKAYKDKQENKDRIDVYTKRANDLNVQLAKDTVALANRRKQILGEHAKSLDGKNSLLKGVGVNIDKYATPMQNALNKTADFTVNRVLPNALKINANKKFGTTNLAEIIGVVSGGRVAGGSVGNATEAAATAVRNQIKP